MQSSRVVLALACVLPAGCQAYGLSTTDLDATFTARQPDREFVGFRTFAMPESVAILDDTGRAAVQRPGDFDETILDSVARGLADAGWTRVGTAEEADVLVVNGVVDSDYLVLYNYWYGYYPYYFYYPPQPVAVSYSGGSVITLMLEPSRLEVIDGIEQVPALWLAGFTGLLRSSDSSTEAAIERGIDQAFRQSEYLVVGDPVDPIFGLDAPLPPIPGMETGTSGDGTGTSGSAGSSGDDSGTGAGT